MPKAVILYNNSSPPKAVGGEIFEKLFIEGDFI